MRELIADRPESEADSPSYLADATTATTCATRYRFRVRIPRWRAFAQVIAKRARPTSADDEVSVELVVGAARNSGRCRVARFF